MMKDDDDDGRWIGYELEFDMGLSGCSTVTLKCTI